MKKILITLILTFLINQALFSSEVTLSQKEKVFLSQHPTITLGSDHNWIPYIIKSKDGNISGYDSDILNAINKATGANFRLVTGIWKDIVDDAKIRKIDGLSTSAVHEERKKFFNFSDVYVTTQRLLIVSNLNPKNIKSVDDLKGKRIGYQKKNLFEEKLVSRYKESIAIAFEDYDLMLEAIVKNKVDVIIGNHPLIYLAQKKGLPFIKVVNKIPNSDLNLVFSIRNDYPEALSILNKGLRALSYDDKIKIHSKWFFSERKNINIKESIKDNTEIFLTNEEMAYLKNKNEISMCVLPNWLPFEQIDENIKHKGIGADIIKVISEKLNKEFVLKPTKEWAESLTNIRDRNCDILPVAMDVPSRRDAMNFTEPYVKEPFVIATTSDKFYIRDVEELSGKKIGIVKSYAIIEVLKAQNPLINIVPVENTKEGLEKVSSGELYGYVDTMPTVGYFIQKHGLFDLKIAGKLSSTIDLSIASRNDEPLLNDILQKALNTISEEEIRTIVGKWIEIKVHQEFDYTKLIYLALFFSSLFIVVLYKNRSINIINKKLELANDENINKQKMVDKYVMLLTTDLEGQITSANEAYCKRVGYEENELIGKKHSIVKHDEMPKELFHDLWKTISTNKTWQGEIKNYTKQKETVYFSVVIEPLFSSGKKIGYRSISVDITDKKRIEQLSITDKLTGLYNRFKIDELLGKQINIFKRYNTDFSVVLFDIDDFKNVNDTYGHDVGDYVLKEISTIVRKNVRKTDEIGRWGGEEFIVICTNTSKDDAFKLAEKIRVAIEHHTFKDINKITVSLGTTSFIKDEDITSLFKRVDTGLYKAKNNGKNRTISI